MGMAWGPAQRDQGEARRNGVISRPFRRLCVCVRVTIRKEEIAWNHCGLAGDNIQEVICEVSEFVIARHEPGALRKRT